MAAMPILLAIGSRGGGGGGDTGPLWSSCFFSSHELSWRSRSGERINITPKKQCSMTIAALSIFGTKIVLTGVRSRVKESSAKRLI